jgi:hypothetical protein
VAGQSLIPPQEKRRLTHIPTANILVKGICFIKHRWHFSHIAHIPTTNILVKGRAMLLGVLQTIPMPLPDNI